MNDPSPEAMRAFDEILGAQPYRFMGMAAKALDNGRGVILHPQTLERIGMVEPGDSFVDYDAMQKYATRIPPPV